MPVAGEVETLCLALTGGRLCSSPLLGGWRRSSRIAEGISRNLGLAGVVPSGIMTVCWEDVGSILLVAASVVALGSARVEPEQVLRGPAPAWAVPSALLPRPENVAGPVFIRRQDLEMYLSGKGQAQHTGYRIKILQPSALQLGNLSVVWNPTAGPSIGHHIRLYRDGQVTNVLKRSSSEVLRREGQLEAAKFDGRLTAVPRVRVGDELKVNSPYLRVIRN